MILGFLVVSILPWRAVLLHQAIGDQLSCIFVNNGLLRKDEFSSVLNQYHGMGLNVKGVDAINAFYRNWPGYRP